MNFKTIKTPLGTIGELIANGQWTAYRDNEDTTVFDNGFGMRIYVMDGCSEEDKDEFQEPFKGVDFMGKKFSYYRRKDHMVWIYTPRYEKQPIKLACPVQKELF
jgi:hypothetical protein